MSEQPLDMLPLWGFFLMACLVVAGSLEFGYRLGVWRHGRMPDEKDTSLGGIVGSILGLVAFLLAFTFGVAVSRSEERRRLVLNEANAIGTADLRTLLLPKDEGDRIASLLGQYVKVRLQAVAAGSTVPDMEKAIARSVELQNQMWTLAVAAAEKHPTVMTSLFVQALNDVIDIHSERVLIGIRSRLPFVIWAVLFGITIVGMAATGYQTGLSGTRRSLITWGLIVSFALVFTLIADLDRPASGLLRTNQAALIDLQKTLRSP